jgi:hypothetical protein
MKLMMLNVFRGKLQLHLSLNIVAMILLKLIVQKQTLSIILIFTRFILTILHEFLRTLLKSWDNVFIKGCRNPISTFDTNTLGKFVLFQL